MFHSMKTYRHQRGLQRWRIQREPQKQSGKNTKFAIWNAKSYLLLLVWSHYQSILDKGTIFPLPLQQLLGLAVNLSLRELRGEGQMVKPTQAKQLPAVVGGLQRGATGPQSAGTGTRVCGLWKDKLLIWYLFTCSDSSALFRKIEIPNIWNKASLQQFCITGLDNCFPVHLAPTWYWRPSAEASECFG